MGPHQLKVGQDFVDSEKIFINTGARPNIPAMAIDQRCDGIDLCAAGPLWLGVDDERHAVRLSRSARIGLTKEVDRLLRFYERGSGYVSGPRDLRSRGASGKVVKRARERSPNTAL